MCIRPRPSSAAASRQKEQHSIDAARFRTGREGLVVTPSSSRRSGKRLRACTTLLFLTLPVAAVRRRPCRAFTADVRRATEVCATGRSAAGRGGGGGHARRGRHRTRALIVVLWRAGLRISEALALAESDLDRERGAILVRRGKGGKRREVGMDRWAWEQIDPWLRLRVSPRVGALLCVVNGPTQGRPWSAPGCSGDASPACGPGRRASSLRAASA
jgi:integrase